MADMSQLDSDAVAGRLLTAVRLIHALFLVSVPSAALITALFPKLGLLPVYDGGDPLLRSIETTLGGLSILCLFVGLSWPRLARWQKTSNRKRSDVIFGHILRVSFFEPVGLSGLALGIVGSSWIVMAPFFVLPAIALIFTFPTDKRLARWQNRQIPTKERL